MPDVFISYSRHDLEAVSRLANAIQQAGYDVWWDAELPPHKSYSEVIEEKVETAKAAVVVWSPTARESEWVRAEADMARSQKKLIQTALGDIIPPLPFNQIQFADLGDWNGETDHPGWKKVLESLRDLCGDREAAGGGEAAAVAATPAKPEPTPAPAPAPAPMPEPASAPVQAAHAGPPPGSVEYYRGKQSKAPIILGAVIGGVAILAAAIGLFVSFSDDYSDDSYDPPPITLDDPSSSPGSDDFGLDLTPPVIDEPSPTQAPVPSPEPPQQLFATSAQNFSGMINAGTTRDFSVGLNANQGYMIVAECDVDCSDIDLWLYDENGIEVASDVLLDDVPVLEITPVRSANFRLEIGMVTCSIEPCGFEILVQPM